MFPSSFICFSINIRYCIFLYFSEGDRQLEKEFDEMEPEEAKRRLKVLAVEMDSDKDGFVSRQELIDWIMNSFRYQIHIF